MKNGPSPVIRKRTIRSNSFLVSEEDAVFLKERAERFNIPRLYKMESGAPDCQVMRRRGAGQKLYRKCNSMTRAPVRGLVMRPN